MKLKEGFILRQVAGTWIILAVGAACVDFNGVLTLNDSGAQLWKLLEAGKTPRELVDALLQEYEVSQSQAQADVDEFLNTLRQAGCLME